MSDALATLPVETLQTYLGQAITARHNILTQRQAQSVRFMDGERTFTTTNLAALDNYIAELNSAIFAKSSGAPTRRTAIYPGMGF